MEELVIYYSLYPLVIKAPKHQQEKELHIKIFDVIFFAIKSRRNGIKKLQTNP